MHQEFQALSAADVDVTVGSLSVTNLALAWEHVDLGRNALTSFNSLYELTLEGAVPLSFVTDDFLIALRKLGVTKLEFLSTFFTVRRHAGWANQIGRRILAVDYDGTYPHLDAGLTAFLFDSNISDQQLVVLALPAARVSKDICKRILEVSSQIAHLQLTSVSRALRASSAARGFVGMLLFWSPSGIFHDRTSCYRLML